MHTLIQRHAIMLDVTAENKKETLQALSDHLGMMAGQNGRTVFDAMLERERLGSTGVGKGLAVPHARIPGINKVYAVMARFASPVEFNALDGQPVDMMFMLLSPHDAGADHLKALSTISYALRDAVLCQRLRAAHSIDEVYELLTMSEDAQKAA